MKEFGLALSGGSAKGYAHIGVLRALREHGIVPDMVAGTSAGAIVGALWCKDGNLELLEKFKKEASFLTVIRKGIGWNTGGIVNMKHLYDILHEYVPIDDFDSLSVPLKVVASNLNSGQPIIFQSGPLHKAVAASSSIPYLFQPIKIEEDFYVDGGLTWNLPSMALRNECKKVIGVNLLPAQLDAEFQPKSAFTVIQRCFEVGIQNTIGVLAANCDLVIEPINIRKFGVFDFNKIDAIEAAGYETTVQYMPQIKALLAKT
jgi:NTE family protein